MARGGDVERGRGREGESERGREAERERIEHSTRSNRKEKLNILIVLLGCDVSSQSLKAVVSAKKKKKR